MPVLEAFLEFHVVPQEVDKQFSGDICGKKSGQFS
jgi:hypothetical protein